MCLILFCVPSQSFRSCVLDCLPCYSIHCHLDIKNSQDTNLVQKCLMCLVQVKEGQGSGFRCSAQRDGSIACKEQEQVHTVTEEIILDIFTPAYSIFSSNHRLLFASLLLLSNGSHIYVYFWISSASRRPSGKFASSLHRGQSRRLYFVAHKSCPGVQHSCMWELCVDLWCLFPKVTLGHSQVSPCSHWLCLLY